MGKSALQCWQSLSGASMATWCSQVASNGLHVSPPPVYIMGGQSALSVPASERIPSSGRQPPLMSPTGLGGLQQVVLDHLSAAACFWLHPALQAVLARPQNHDLNGSTSQTGGVPRAAPRCVPAPVVAWQVGRVQTLHQMMRLFQCEGWRG